MTMHFPDNIFHLDQLEYEKHEPAFCTHMRTKNTNSSKPIAFNTLWMTYVIKFSYDAKLPPIFIKKLSESDYISFIFIKHTFEI